MQFLRRRHDQLLEVRVVPSQRVIFTPGGQVAVSFLVDIRPTTKLDHAPLIDMRFVFDKSGSMRHPGMNDDLGVSKIEALRQGVSKVVAEDLMPGDFALLEAFNDGSETVVAHQQLTAEIQHLLAEKILLLEAGGFTHFSVAMETAMNTPLIPNTQPRIIFLTDGKSEGGNSPERDYAKMEELARRSHQLNLPWLIFGTGIGYNKPWLERLALMAAPGSAFKHVSDISTLEADLRGEISFLRGLAVDRLKVTAKTNRGIRIERACHFMPDLREMKLEQEGRHFSDDSGGVDHLRGQQYLIHLLVDSPGLGDQQLLSLHFEGTSLAQGQLKFTADVPLKVNFTDQHVKETRPEQEVVRAQQKLIAKELVAQGKFKAGSEAFRKAGDPAMADLVQTLGNVAAGGGRQGRDAIHTLKTATVRVLTRDYTVVDSDDSDDTPSQS